MLTVVAAERSYSAIAFHVAVGAEQGVVGYQTLDLWSRLLRSMSHVGQVGTFLLPEWRGLGVGKALWNATAAFSRAAGYCKLALHVRASNLNAQRFYERLGFTDCGRMQRQVIIDGVEDDEVLMEVFL